MGQPGFFDLQHRYEGLDAKGDPLVAIAASVPFELFRRKLNTALISERVTAGMRAAKNRGKRLGRPKIRPALVAEIERLASSTNLSVRQIHQNLSAQASRGFIGEITKRARAAEGFSLASQAV